MGQENNSQYFKKSGTSYKFARNSLFNVAGFVITFPILILLTPYMLHILGKSKFGIWAIAGVVTSYAQLSDMGMTTGIVKFVAEYWIKKDINKISEIVSTVFFSFAVVGGTVVVVLLLARHFIVVSILKVPQEMQSEAIFVISGVVIIFYFNLLFSVYNSVLLGIQRMDVTNAIMVVSKILRCLGMWIFLAYGFGLKGLIWNSAIFSVLTAGTNAFFASKLTKGLKVKPSGFSLTELQRVAKYSINVFLARLMGLGLDPINKIILAVYTSLPFVSFYEVGWRVQQMVRQLFQVGLQPLLPASSELHAQKEKKEMEKIYLSISHILYLFAVPLFLFMIVLAKPLVEIWLGSGYILAARAIQFLLLGNLFSLIVTPQYIILQGIGKPQLTTLEAGVTAFLNILIAIISVQLIGYYGVLFAVFLSLFLSSIFLMYLYHKESGYSFLKYFKSLPIKLVIIILLINLVLLMITEHISEWKASWVFLIVTFYCILYLIMFLILRPLNDYEKNVIIKLKNCWLYSRVN